MARKMLYLEWYDHYSTHGWLDPEEIQDHQKIFSAGILMRESKKYLTISSGVSEDGKWSDPLTIIKSCIVKRRVLK